MVVDLDEHVVADGQQAVALDVVFDVVVDGGLVQVVALDEELRVKAVLEHGKILLSLS